MEEIAKQFNKVVADLNAAWSKIPPKLDEIDTEVSTHDMQVIEVHIEDVRSSLDLLRDKLYNIMDSYIELDEVF